MSPTVTVRPRRPRYSWPVISTLDSLGKAQYALVTTYRKDGRSVPTAVWVVRDGNALAIWTVSDSGKVKRIRRNSKILVGPCDLRGRPTGDQVPGEAVILDAEGTQRVRSLLTKKYGIVGRITMWGSRIRRGTSGTIGIRITLT
jgi:PPOX class probable F420-dependent enzyme